MFELTFSSHAATDLDRTVLSKIEKVSTDNNLKIGITGCLFFHNYEFVGILEGREEAVIKVWGKIQEDNRHKTIAALEKGYIDDRQFKRWNMISIINEGGTEDKTGYRLSVENILALVELSDKRTYGSRVFWNCVRNNLIKPESLGQ